MDKISANVARFLSQSARRNPTHCAIKAPLGRNTSGQIDYDARNFAELELESSQTARHLLSQGIQRGSRVLLMVRPGLDLIRITFALFKIGAVPVVIDPGMGLRSFCECVRRSQPDSLVGIPIAQCLGFVFRKAFQSLKSRVWVGSGFSRKLGDIIAAGPLDAVDCAEDELAAILFTSGSTGPPKGVLYQHGQFDAQIRQIREAYDILPGEVDLPMLPIFALFNPALGMTTVVPEINPSRPASVDPAKIIQAIEQNQVSNSFGSPVLWTKILRHCQKSGVRMPSIRRILMAGAPVAPALMRDLRAFIPNGTIHTPYGATEALPVSSIDHPTVLSETWQKTKHGAGTCVGHAMPEITIRIIAISDEMIANGSKLSFLPAGQIGEIIVQGPVVTHGYDGLSDATAAAKILDAEGGFWHRMGDLGYLDDHDRLWFCGRKVERVQTANGPLYTDPCEAVFNDHPHVFRSALIGLGEAPNQKPAIVVEPEVGKIVDYTELRELALAQEHTASIDSFFTEKQFPVDVRHNAKIHRRTLAKKFRKS